MAKKPKPLTRGERVIAFIERYCLVPEGTLLGKPVKLLPFQRKFILAVYDNPNGTSRAYLSIARKNGKTGLIACLLLAHIVGPEAYTNGRIVSGARSRKQAAEVFNYAAKMVMMSPQLSKLARVVPSAKMIVGLAKNVEYQASSAEAKSAHGGSPILAILDEVGQIKGPTDDFVEAIETSQGAYEGRAMLFAISTQAATDNDLFSRWIDDAETSKDPRIVSHIYSAPAECDLDDRDAWAAANPALGVFRSIKDVEDFSLLASRMPSKEASFRWLFLNQRIDASAPFVAPAVWRACDTPTDHFDGLPVFGGLDLSEVSDLTSLVLMAPKETKAGTVWHVKPTFWLPGDALRDKAKADRIPYDVWNKPDEAGGRFLETTPGPTVDYEFVAHHLRGLFDRLDIRKIAFDRWNWRHLKPWLQAAGFNDEQLEGDAAVFEQFGQGFASMSPALRELESLILNKKIAHGGHPVLTMCMMNATVKQDPSGNRKLDKLKSRGRIDGAVALTMATAMAGTYEGAADTASPWDDPEFSINKAA
ncbi:terminase large subunit [Rhizobium sp. NLR10a]|uniref:terminase large subunit n=1 Tax=unclassified Rhizobium TaxID=2613769 RepID=UPI001C8309EF|nr:MULTISPECIES: terminase TerL endonuclease subunit [unclassified Rhizobium]MBX5279121.1 terminase large subunit [Rhizobium sp. NLR13a]MBX5285171.1 terminase large subunit [Rhizobium sp. NLR10a]MBX5293043.1 terminase large subunit [Rhizobium sp. NLR15a]